jgi:pimeloyl-ACP methyl ester carboxylesterase
LRLTRAAPLALAGALLLAGCGGSETTTQPLLAPAATAAEPPAATAPPEDSGAPLLHHACEGEGSPTVILEAGLGSPSGGWQALQQQLASVTRTCRYDRAGLGQSPAAEPAAARTAAQHVEELAALLEREEIDPPYVLAGHSYGGSLARLFAHTRRDDVAGIVLIDSPHPDERDRYLAALPAGDGDPVVARLRAQLGMLHDPAANPEHLDWEASMAEVRAAGALGDLPLVVITAGRAGPRAVAGLDPSLVEPLEDVRMELQRDLAGLSGNRVHVIATESGHSVPDPQSGQPQVIFTAVDAVVRSSRLHVPLPSCEALFTQPATRCVGAG